MPVVAMQPSLEWAGSGSPRRTRTTHSTHHTSGGLHFHRKFNRSWSQQPTHLALSPIPTSNSQGPLPMQAPWPTIGTSGNALWQSSPITLQLWSGEPRLLSLPWGLQPTCSGPRVCTKGATAIFFNAHTSRVPPTCLPTSRHAVLTCPMMPSYVISPLSLLIHRTGRC